jgi:hypothetical protein
LQQKAAPSKHTPHTENNNHKLKQGEQRKGHSFEDEEFIASFGFFSFYTVRSKMTTLRQFTMDDLLKFNNINLDVLTETYNMAFYMSYMSRWPESFSGKCVNRSIWSSLKPAWNRQENAYMPTR